MSWTLADDASSRNADVQVIDDVAKHEFHVHVKELACVQARGFVARVEALETDEMDACKGAGSTVGAVAGRYAPRLAAHRSRGIGRTHVHVPCRHRRLHRPLRTFHGEMPSRTSASATVRVGWVCPPPPLVRGPFVDRSLPPGKCSRRTARMGPFLGPGDVPGSDPGPAKTPWTQWDHLLPWSQTCICTTRDEYALSTSVRAGQTKERIRLQGPHSHEKIPWRTLPSTATRHRPNSAFA